MISAVDSSVLLSILKGEGDAEAWMDILVRHAALGELVVGEVVAAEVATLFKSQAEFLQKLNFLNISFRPSTPESAFVAGQIFLKYRREGGARKHLIPDFLVGAHALQCADGLIANDRGYLRRYFKGLKVIGSS